MRQPKLNKYFNILARVLIVVVSVYFVWDRIFNGDDFDKISTVYMDLFDKPGVPLTLLILIVLMIINLGIETIKWRKLIAQVEKINVGTAVKAVLTGITVSIFSPNRVGEFFGRVFILKNTQPMKGILLTVVGSMSQMMMTIIAGSIALIFFVPYYFPLNTELYHWFFWGIVFLFLTVNGLILLLFVNVQTVSRFAEWASRKKWIHTFNYLRLLENLPKSLLIKVLLLSASRYLVFSSQFYIMLWLFGITLPVLQAFMIIPIIYLVLAIIPTYALSELGVRGSVAITLIGMHFFHSVGSGLTASESLAILSATTSLWVLNLAIPALIGTFFVYKLRFFRK